MFALIRVDIVAPPRFFAKYTKNVWRLEKTSDYWIMTVLWPINADDKERRRRFGIALDSLSRLGVAGVVLPPDFEYPDMPMKYGMVVSTPVPLFRRIAGKMAWKACGNIRSLGIYGRKVTPEIESCVDFMKDKVKLFMLSVGNDTDAYCFALQKKYGIAAGNVINPGADVVILFACPPDVFNLKERCIVINVSGAVPAFTNPCLVYNYAVLQPKTDGFWPPDCDMPAFMAAQVGSGTLSVADIAIDKLLLKYGSHLYCLPRTHRLAEGVR